MRAHGRGRVGPPFAEPAEAAYVAVTAAGPTAGRSICCTGPGTHNDRSTEAKARRRGGEAAVRAQRHPSERDSESGGARRSSREFGVQGSAGAAAVRAGSARSAPAAVEQAVTDRSVADSVGSGRAWLEGRR